MRQIFPAAGLAVFGLLACGDPNQLPPANFQNVVDTLTVYALSGTEVWRPSGYAATEFRVVRLDQTNSADFAFDIRGTQPVLLPAQAIGQPGSRSLSPGLLNTPLVFDEITYAENSGYNSVDTVHAAVGQSFYLRARAVPSCFLGTPTYAKLEVLAIDDQARTMTFRVLVNLNCGYKGLEPGLPTR
ncbi:MAG: hypothetical protein AAB075_02230 [Gemmatimonadota bacterium]